CSRGNIDALSCFDAVRVFVRDAELGRKCGSTDGAQLTMEIRRARKISSVMSRKAQQLFDAQLADDGVYRLAYNTLKSYVCMSIVNYYRNAMAGGDARVTISTKSSD